MKKLFEKFPFHSFLILPYLAIFLYAKNAHLLSIGMIIRPLLVSLVFSSLFLFVAYFLFCRNIIKAGLWTSFVLFFMANYGFIYDYLEILYYQGYWPFSNIHRYLIFFFFVLFIVAFLFIRYSKYYFFNLTRWLNILLPMLIVANLIFILVNTNLKERRKLTYTCDDTPVIHTSVNKPDVYYFILDGFANRRTIEEFYKARFDTFYNFLQANGFYIADSSFANYYFTYSSLTATLNMNYLDHSQSISLSDNLVFRVFKSLGYNIYNINSGYAVSRYFICVDVDLNNEIINDYERAILKSTIFRLDDLIGIIPYLRIKQQFDYIRNFDFRSNSPKFVFAHIVCPHPPYVFNRNGELSPVNSFSDKTWDPKDAYIEQLTFIGLEIMNIIRAIKEVYKNAFTQPIIIIQSDHGPFFSNYSQEVIKYCRTHILNAFHVSKPDSLYKHISSVNTFRYIFRYEMGLNTKLLKDSMAGINDLISIRNFKDLGK